MTPDEAAVRFAYEWWCCRCSSDLSDGNSRSYLNCLLCMARYGYGPRTSNDNAAVRRLQRHIDRVDGDFWHDRARGDTPIQEMVDSTLAEWAES